MNINSNFWELYKTYQTYHEAFCMIGFVMNLGYAGSLIREQKDGQYSLFVLRANKGAKLNG